MKTKERLQQAVDATQRTLKRHPIEMIVALHTFVAGVFIIADSSYSMEEDIVVISVLILALAYILNCLFPVRVCAKNEKQRLEEVVLPKDTISIATAPKNNKLRWIYYFSWLPLISLWVVDYSNWIETWDFAMALIIAFLGVFVARRTYNNHSFASEAARYIVNAVFALIFTSVAFALIMAIYTSIVYIFGFEYSSDFLAYTVLFAYTIPAPLMFFSFIDHNINRLMSPNRFLDTLLNYIFTPALLIYTVVLYIYFIKITITWSLPEGNVAYMVFMFTLTAMLVKACQPLLSKRYYDWFFDRFTFIAIPTLVMFWVGVVYRINEYGLTQWRFYLLLCGVIMTLTLLMFVRTERGNYLSATLVAIVLFALFTYIPPISAETIAMQSQYKRVVKIASGFGMLDEQGKFKRDESSLPDIDWSAPETAQQVEKLESGLIYITKERLEGLGLDYWYELRDLYPQIIEKTHYADPYEGNVYIYYQDEPIDITPFREMHLPDGYRHSKNKYYYSQVDDMFLLYERVDSVAAFVKPVDETDEDEDAKEEATHTIENSEFKVVFEISTKTLLKEQLAKTGCTIEDILNESPDAVSHNKNDMLRYDAKDMTFVFGSMTINTSTTPQITYLSLRYLFLR